MSQAAAPGAAARGAAGRRVVTWTIGLVVLAAAAVGERPARADDHPPPAGDHPAPADRHGTRARPVGLGPAAPSPPDYDHAAEHRSRFWGGAAFPRRSKYHDLVTRAGDAMEHSDSRSLALAASLLRDAVTLDPDRAAAHMALGRLAARKGDFTTCASELGRVLELDPAYQPDDAGVPAAWATGYELAECEARAGAYESAIEHLRRILEAGASGPVALVHQRLGESYMALGRLKEAIEAFRQAMRLAPYDASHGFSLAVAYDRDGKSEQSRDRMTWALGRDRRLSSLGNSHHVWIPPADAHYTLGLAHLVAGEAPAALFHFRRYLETAGESPWAARARLHYDQADREITTGADVEVHGTASLDDDKARAAIARAAGPLEACVDKTPDLLLTVLVTRRVDRKAARGARGRAHQATADDDPAQRTVRVLVADQEDVNLDAMRASIRCVEAAAHRISLPRPTGGPGSYAVAEFSLIAR